MKFSEAINIIEEEIEKFEKKRKTGPGRFIADYWVDHGGKYPALIYEYKVSKEDEKASWPLPGPSWRDCDDPWKRWGGDRIIKAIEARGLRFRGGWVESSEDWGIVTYSDAAAFDYEGRGEDGDDDEDF